VRAFSEARDDALMRARRQRYRRPLRIVLDTRKPLAERAGRFAGRAVENAFEKGFANEKVSRSLQSAHIGF
jgi:hypothetical protein